MREMTEHLSPTIFCSFLSQFVDVRKCPKIISSIYISRSGIQDAWQYGNVYTISIFSHDDSAVFVDVFTNIRN